MSFSKKGTPAKGRGLVARVDIPGNPAALIGHIRHNGIEGGIVFLNPLQRFFRQFGGTDLALTHEFGKRDPVMGDVILDRHDVPNPPGQSYWFLVLPIR